MTRDTQSHGVRRVRDDAVHAHGRSDHSADRRRPRRRRQQPRRCCRARFTLPYALIQPLLGALADMFSKTRLIIVCMLALVRSRSLRGFATSFEVMMACRVLAGIAAGGVFPIALAHHGRPSCR